MMFDELLIKKLTLMAGRSPQKPSQTIDVCNMTVFVGPNSSGKSLALTELADSTQNRHPIQHRVLEGIQFTSLTEAEAEFIASRYGRMASRDDGNVAPNTYLFFYKGGRDASPKEYFLNVLKSAEHHADAFRRLYLNNVTSNLDGNNRTGLVSPQGMGDMRTPDPFNPFQALFLDDSKRSRVRDILYRAFKKYFVLDPTSGQLRVAFANEPAKDKTVEQGLHEEARAYYLSAELIDTFSAGVKAYTGMIIELVAGSPRIVLMDEPEAFLYPPLAQQLGFEVATLASETKKNVFASTHSAHFVMGCLQAGVPLDVVRLTFRNGIATARILRNQELVKLMRNPLLRSTGVIQALFYEAVVVTESDTDRAFYQEINERLLKSGRGIPNCLFLNAQNKQTVRMITGPLRELGIPTISIVDVDVFKDGGKTWSSYLKSGFVPDIEIRSMGLTRDALLKALVATGFDMKADGGISLLSGNDLEAARNLLERLREYGLFIVPGGEVEAWLKNLGVPGKGPQWLGEMFEKMGEDPKDAEYLSPTNSDVWEFIDRLAAWFANPNRKGIPE